ncbi:DUF5709 domain-containing protein [Nocardioides sp. Kera G14]|uniref:DUF5709 domain-containing protein n=1 Tax=Nocardioides sp. Kera G14 TaxID=2884264 RepID=UPI001D11D83E|nr:DUF5709 domain-containing protein [Nocardioides sp. Kera G14]UDY24658.1 DUF5709 domain-containing protein [Nocardioides sp. Kera G14]
MTESGQLQPEETLDDRGVDDVLDEGISPPERPRGLNDKATTELGQLEGETLDERIAQEEPDIPVPDAERLEPGFEADEEYDDRETDDPEDLYAGDARSGRLVAPDEGAHEDEEKDSVASDVGIDGAGASAEEAAMHVVSEDDI